MTTRGASEKKKPNVQLLLEEIGKRGGMTIIECQEFLWNLSRPNVPFDRKINRGFWSTTLPEFIPLWCKRDDKTRKWSLIPGLEIKSPFFRLKTERDLVPNVFDLLLADDDIDEVVP